MKKLIIISLIMVVSVILFAGYVAAYHGSSNSYGDRSDKSFNKASQRSFGSNSFTNRGSNFNRPSFTNRASNFKRPAYISRRNTGYTRSSFSRNKGSSFSRNKGFIRSSQTNRRAGFTRRSPFGSFSRSYRR